MSVSVDLLSDLSTVVVTRSGDVTDAAWALLSQGVLDSGGNSHTSVLELSWADFLGFVPRMAFILREQGVEVEYSTIARSRIDILVEENAQTRTIRDGGVLPPRFSSTDELNAELATAGWDLKKRAPTNEQSRDVRRMVSLMHGANFSVPGAGKTTAALAVHMLATDGNTGLLVIAPKNAFPAWDEVLVDCLVSDEMKFIRLVGGRQAVRNRLGKNPKLAIMTYQMASSLRDVVRDFMLRQPTHLILDESHRMKGGLSTDQGSAMLSLSPYAVRRDILSGTPMPNAVSDLAAQYEFLWPGQSFGSDIVSANSPADVIGPLYVRTTKRELGIPDAITRYVEIGMSEPQAMLYGVFRDQVLADDLSGGVTSVSRNLKANVFRLVHAAIDPLGVVNAVLAANTGPLVADETFLKICDAVIDERRSPRMAAVADLARELAESGRKSVVWSPFLHGIEALKEDLEDLGAFVIHGGVPAGDEGEEGTREWIVKQFHEDPSRMVLIANPAAGGEGISLHKVCHDAIFLGRTYNAAHYMQARDRIHRLGLKEGDETNIVVFESTTAARLVSIDLSIRNRLDSKIRAMGQILDDEDLRTLSLESGEADETLTDDDMSFDDIRNLIAELKTDDD